MSPTFLAYLVILWFEKRRPKQKYCFSPKVKHFGSPKFWVGYATATLIKQTKQLIVFGQFQLYPISLSIS